MDSKTEKRSASSVGWKNPSADLHRKSPFIFLVCLGFSILLTAGLLHYPIAHKESITETVHVPPVIQLQNIPKTSHAPRLPAPAKPFIPGSLPIVVDEELVPDDLVMENANQDFDVFPPEIPIISFPEKGTSGAKRTTEEIFELFMIEESPTKINNIAPEYPPIAKRAGIEGTVYIKVLVNKKGLVDSIEVTKGPKVFHQSAIEAARATKFVPAKLNNKSVSCWVIMPYRFVLQN